MAEDLKRVPISENILLNRFWQIGGSVILLAVAVALLGYIVPVVAVGAVSQIGVTGLAFVCTMAAANHFRHTGFDIEMLQDQQNSN
jgi:hypothetical protein